MNFESHSQAGQDRFVWELLGPGPGTFLDIGANHPVDKSNTYELERHGWSGALVENDAHCVELLKAQRKARLLACDATQVHWSSFIDCTKRIDYLSLDVDEASLQVLYDLLGSGATFNILTIEHDAYRFGEARSVLVSEWLREDGYHVLCENVCDQGLPFETWAVHGDFIQWPQVKRFRRNTPTDWKEFFA